MQHTLTKNNAHGTEQFWTIDVQGNTITITWGVQNGKTQTNKRVIEEGKQKRTKEEQALFEAKSLMKNKLRSGYEDEQNTQVQIKSPLPMLAKECKESTFSNDTQICVQPKLDGIRCLVNVQTGELWSRKQTRICGLDHISNAIIEMKIPDDIKWLDGELYTHNESFNSISSKVRRTANFTKESIDVQYWIYDCVSSSPFIERNKLLKKYITQSKIIVLTPTQNCIFSNKIIGDIHDDATSEGYEGIMVRNANSKYDIGKRSNSLLKMKKFLQEEFLVVGFKQKRVVNGVITLGSVILQDFNNKELVFSATPVMTNEEKLEIWNNQCTYMGQIATIKFFEKTPKGIPRFPNLLGFRHPDDC